MGKERKRSHKTGMPREGSRLTVPAVPSAWFLRASLSPSLPLPGSFSSPPSSSPSSALLSPSPLVPALLLRVLSFPRESLPCPPILAWISTGVPGTSTVSMPKSWLWAIAVSQPGFFHITLSYNWSPSTRCGQDQPPTTIHSKQVRPEEHHFHHWCFFRRQEGYREWGQGSSPALGHCWPGAFS